MPQFEAATFAPQLVWLILTFVGLYFIMVRVALPRIGGILEERHHRITTDLDRAEALKRETEEAREAYEAALAAARAKAHEIAAATRRELDEGVAARKSEFVAQLSRETEEANKRIGAALAAAKENVGEIAAEATAAIMGRLAGAAPDNESLRKTVAAALKARETR